MLFNISANCNILEHIHFFVSIYNYEENTVLVIYALMSHAIFANILLYFILCLLATKFQVDQTIINKIIYFCQHLKICSCINF